MRELYEVDYVNGLRVIRLPEDSPVITMEYLKAVQDAIDDEDAVKAFRTGS